MADKKITELTLRDEVTSDLNLPSDDGIQSYRVTAAQMKSFILANQNILLAMLKDDIFNGLTGVSAADDDYFPLIDTSDSNKTKKALVSTFARNLYRSVVNPSNEAILSTDGTVKISGTTGAVVLPTAVGIAGKRYKFVHSGTNFVAYTINTTSSQTIGSVAAGSYKLFTNGEVLEVESDGANWLIMGRHTETGWIDCGANTIIAVSGGTNPTKATTPDQDKVFLYRNGSRALIRILYRHTNNSGAAHGSTTGYRFTLPVTAASTFNSTTSVGFGSGSVVTAQINAKCGYGEVGIASGTNGNASVNLHDSTTVGVWVTQVSGSTKAQVSSSFFGLANSTIAYTLDIDIPVNEWQP